MKNQAFVVTGLGWGDEGKGKVTLYYSTKHNAHTIIRTGACQALHRVVTTKGQEHVHAQFGSGTLSGAATHLSKHMVIDPYAIISEGKIIQDDLGITNVFSLMTIHEDALVITPFQAIANRVREIVRQGKRYGSVGVGVGETVTDAEIFGTDAIRARDLASPELREKLRAIQIRKIADLAESVTHFPELSSEDRKRAYQEIGNLHSLETIEWAVEWANHLAAQVRIVNTDFVATKILGREGTVVFEGSQGVLLDRKYGFHPYITKVRTLPDQAHAILGECGYPGEIKNIGILRAYHTRHGAGPFVAESPELTVQLPDPSNKTHLWQGNFRVGSFDIVAANYAIKVASQQRLLDGLILTCVDRIQSLGNWQVCTSYKADSIDRELFLGNDAGFITGIKVFAETNPRLQEHQKRLTVALGQCQPQVAEFKMLPARTKVGRVDIFRRLTEHNLRLPLVGISTGPTDKDMIEF